MNMDTIVQTMSVVPQLRVIDLHDTALPSSCRSERAPLKWRCIWGSQVNAEFKTAQSHSKIDRDLTLSSKSYAPQLCTEW